MRVVVVVMTRQPAEFAARASAHMSEVLPPPPASATTSPRAMAKASRIGSTAMLNAATAFLDEHVAAGRADRPALITPGGALAYGELHALACRVGAKLRQLDVQPESRVVLLLHDTPAFVAAFFGAIRVGAVAVPLSTRLAPEGVAAILDEGNMEPIEITVRCRRGEAKRLRLHRRFDAYSRKMYILAEEASTGGPI